VPREELRFEKKKKLLGRWMGGEGENREGRLRACSRYDEEAMNYYERKPPHDGGREQVSPGRGIHNLPRGVEAYIGTSKERSHELIEGPTERKDS